MGDTFEYLIYVVNIEIRNDKSRIIYVSFGDAYFEIEFSKACCSKLVISPRRIVILKIEVADVKNTCW